jgi:hypothetical protein
MVNINNFVAGFKGGARNDKFRVIITYPAVVGNPNVQDYLRITTAALPGSTVSPTQVFFQGRAIPLLGDRQNEPFSMTILNDTDFSHRAAFERWLNAINSHTGNVQTGTYQSLLGTVQIDQLDRDDSVLKTVILQNAFPDMLSQIDLDYGAIDQAEIYTCSFGYTHWTSDTTT